jgi:thiopeptide-type bacteriocin biosynthesis protein
VNQGTDPQHSGRSWQQVAVQFHDYSAAERTAVAHLGPAMTTAEAGGLVTCWWFIRKAPRWRLRYLATDPSTEREARTFVRQSLDTLGAAGRIARWVETIYEPEVHAFGGPAAMNVAHCLFHQDSRHILDYLGGPRATASAGDKRRELSVLLCAVLMRGAEQDWCEQGDIWARLADNRPLPPGTAPDRLHRMEPDLRRILTVDAGPTSPLLSQDGSLAYLAGWAAAFDAAGKALGHLAHDGALRRGVRSVITHHVIFHWNRIGLPHETQSILAHAAKAAVLGE